MRKSKGLPIAPFTVIVDTREQAPYHFRDISNDKSRGGGQLIIMIERKALATGDYSIKGIENEIAVERKELGDFFHCVGSDRDRFENQLERLNKMEFGAIVIEAGWDRVLKGYSDSKVTPKTVYRSVIAWQQKKYFPRVHWWFCPGKGFAELTTFRILERYDKERLNVSEGGQVAGSS